MRTANSLCSKDCTYRGLYEGSQASLADMAARQAGALNRVSRLRAGMIAAMKRTWPAEFLQSEERMGRRLSSCEDEVVIALMDGHLAALQPHLRPAPVPPAGLGALREALQASGVALPAGEDLSAWAAAVARSGTGTPALPEPAAPPVVVAPPPAVPELEGEQYSDDTHHDDPSFGLDYSQDPTADYPVSDAGEPAGEWDSLWQEEQAPPPSAPGSDLDDLFGSPAATSDLSDLFDDPSLLVQPAADAQPAQAQPAEVEEVPPAAEVAVDDAPAAPAASGGRDLSQGSMRPQLFPGTTLPKAPRRDGRGPKASRPALAQVQKPAPDVPLDGEPEELTAMTAAAFDKLVASVCIPRPVFISDLQAQTGSKPLVAAWEARCGDMGTRSPVRFITPKARHRDRGSLVIPHDQKLRAAAAEFSGSWWAQCLDERRLRGAVLYETAVLLHRFGADVLSSRVEGNTLVLRVKSQQGIIGVVMSLTSETAAGTTGRKDVADAVEVLLGDRLSRVAVLSHNGTRGSLDKLATAIREEAAERGWSPTMPILASQSWDFAADGGASAVLVM